MPIKNEQFNFALIIVLLFIALGIIFAVLRPDSLESFLPFILLSAPIIFLVAFVNTDIALVLLILAMLLSPEFSLGGIQGRDIVVRLDDVLLFIIFFAWLTKTAVNKQLGLLKQTILVPPILLYIVICVLASGIGVLRGTVPFVRSFFYILKYIEYFLLFFLVANNVRDKKQVRIFVAFMLITALIVGIFALYMTFSQGIRATAPFEGPKGEANTLAGYLILMMGIAGGIFIYTRSLRLRIILGTFLGISIWPFLYTYSRSGLIGFFVMYLTLIVLVKRMKVPLLLSFVILAIVAPLIFQKPIFWRARQTFVRGQHYSVMGENVVLDESASARIRSWEDSLKQWMERPLLGYGVGSGRVMYDIQYGRVLREVGLLGMIAFSWLIIRLLKTGWTVFNDRELDGFSRGLSLGYFCALVGLLVMGLGAEVFIIIRIMEPFWFLTGIVVMLPELNYPQELGKNDEPAYT